MARHRLSYVAINLDAVNTPQPDWSCPAAALSLFN
jgi:hypothetical protein